MADRPTYLYRLNVVLPPGSHEPGWEPPGWQDDPEHWGTDPETGAPECAPFTWPAVRRYLSHTAAKQRADLLRSYGATVTIETSAAVEWTTEHRSPTSGLELPDQAILTFHRRRNDDLKPEIVVSAWQPGVGALWGFTLTSDAGFEPRLEVHMDTGQFAAYAAFPAFFQALAERKPRTLDEAAALLEDLNVVDDTAGYEARQAVNARLGGWHDDHAALGDHDDDPAWEGLHDGDVH